MSHQNSNSRSSPKLLGLRGGGERLPRTCVDIPLREKRFSPDIPARLLNLSTVGAFIETIPERESRIIDLEFSFPGQKGSFLITSRIQWCNRPNKFKPQFNRPIGMGVEFLRFVRGTPEELEAFLQKWDDLRGQGKVRHLHSITPNLDGRRQEPENHPTADTLYGDCFYRLHSLEDEEIENSLEQSLEAILEGTSSEGHFSDN